MHDDERHLGLQEGRPELEVARDLLRKLVDIASKGGNYLLNVGPTAEGEIPAAERRAAGGDGPVDGGQRREHLRHDGQPVRQARLGPLHAEAGQALPARVRLAQGRAAGRAGAEEQDSARRISWPTRTASRSAVARAEKDVVINLPATAPDPIDTVVVLEIEGEPRVSP